MGVVLDVAGTDMRSGVEVAGGEEMPPLPWELPWAFSLGLLSFEISRMLFREPAGTKVMIAVRRSGCRTRSTLAIFAVAIVRLNNPSAGAQWPSDQWHPTRR